MKAPWIRAKRHETTDRAWQSAKVMNAKVLPFFGEARSSRRQQIDLEAAGQELIRRMPHHALHTAAGKTACQESDSPGLGFRFIRRKHV
jgi:hypothetical protein